MDSFSLEDIRESFQQDVQAQLDRLICLAQSPTTEAGPMTPTEPSTEDFAVAREVAHAMHGLVSMVRLRSMTDATRVLSSLARLGQASRIPELRRQLRQEIGLVEQALRRMLGHELAKQPDVAWSAAQELRAQLAHRRESLPKVLASVDDSAGSGEGFLVDTIFLGQEQVPAPTQSEVPTEGSFLDDAFDEPRTAQMNVSPPSAAAASEEAGFDFGVDTQANADAVAETPVAFTPVPLSASPTSPVATRPVSDPSNEPDNFLFEGSPAPMSVVDPASAGHTTTERPVSEATDFGFFDEPATSVAPTTGTPPDATPTTASSVPVGVPGLDEEELRATFRQELGESLPVLHGHLRTLFARPNDRSSAAGLERIYHTIKGSAAMVGLTEVSAQAKVLQDTMRAVHETGRAVGLAFLAELLERTNRLLETVGLPGFAAGDVAPADPVPTSAALRRVFQNELAETLSEIAILIAELRVSVGGSGNRRWTELGRVLHRLRGSANLCQELAIAARVGLASTLCRERSPTPDAIKQIAELVRDLSQGVPHGPTEPAVTKPPPVTGGDTSSLTIAITDPQPVVAEGFDPFSNFVPVAERPAVEPTSFSPPTLRSPAAAPPVPRNLTQPDITAELWEVMKAETHELLGQLEQVALNLNESPQPKRVLGELMGLVHTLKGAANSAGLSDTGRALHRVEDVLEGLLSADVLPPMRSVVRMLMQAQDYVRSNLRRVSEGNPEGRSTELDDSIAALQPGVGLTTLGEPADRTEDGLKVENRATPDTGHDRVADTAERGGEPSGDAMGEDSVDKGSADLAAANRDSGDGSRPPPDSVVGRASHGTGSDREPDSASGSGRGSSSAASARRVGDRSERRFVRVASERLDRVMNLTGELVVSRTRILRRLSQLRQWQRDMTAGKDRIATVVDNFRQRYEFNPAASGAGIAGIAVGGSAILGNGAPQAPEPAPSRSLIAIDPTGKSAQELMAELLAEAEPLPSAVQAVDRKSFDAHEASGTGLMTGVGSAFGELELDRYEDINILARRLQELGNDLAVIQSQMEDAVARLSNEFDLFGRILGDIQAEVTRARMVPVSQLFDRLRRPIHDAADRLGKLVRVNAVGENVDLDRTIIDELYLPMVHLVRNCVAHGIEPSDARRAAGKDPEGTITLHAAQEAGQLILEVGDDGRGLDSEAIRSRAVRHGLIRSDQAIDETRLNDLIFTSGMSTAAGVGAVSGRGVGGAVVRQEIQKLGGLIRVKSRPGLGATFTIVLPLTLAIRRALLLETAGDVYAVPLNFARRLLDGTTPTSSLDGLTMVTCDGQTVPVWSLAELLGVQESSATGSIPSPGSRLLVLRLGEQEAAFRIDRVLGQDDIVVKDIGAVVSAHPLLAGATLGGDGEVIPILDVAGLLNVAARAAANRTDAATAAAAVLPSRHVGGPLEPRLLRRARAAGQTQPIAPEPLPQPEAGREPTPTRSGSFRVLWADDSLSVRKVASTLLRNLGIDAVMAVDGRDAREKLRESRFDIVFTDLEMPRMNGYELIGEIRRDPSTASLPVVVVTSRSSEKHRQFAFAAGANDYLTKPFSPEQIREKLASIAQVPQR